MIKPKFFTLGLCLSILFLTSCSSDDTASGPIDVVIEGATVSPEVGGPNQPNQVYVDLSSNTSKAVKRDSWDLGFYAGSEFRVILNGSIYMAAAKLSATDIDAVTSSSPEVVELQPKVAVGTFEAASSAYIDAPTGELSQTAISEISASDVENQVYLLNLGDKVGTQKPATGSTEVSGESRGWMKVRILRKDNQYVLQYADLDATSHKEVTISKNEAYHFTFFSFDSEKVVNVEPEKKNWDLNFTVFSNIIPGNGAYGYSDFVVNNTKSNVHAYLINGEADEAINYDNFKRMDVDASQFNEDQRSIGSTWRKGGGPDTLPSLNENLFYVVKDTEGNLYKLKFLAMTNEAGERGYPKFVYALLQ